MPSTTEYLNALFSLEGKTALVTGGTRGIGQKMTIALAQAGADIVLLQRNATDTSTASLISSLTNDARKCTIVECDLSDKVQVSQITKKITEEMGLNIDILLNCGGIQRRTPAENFPDSDWEDVLRVNLNAVWVLARDVGRHMLQSRGGVAGEQHTVVENPRGNGKIINIASLCSYQGGITVPAYTAAKHGVMGLTKALSNEWVSKGVNVNGIAPGYIDTDMNTALLANPTRPRQILERIPANRWGKPDDFEGAVVWLAGRGSDYVSGETVVVDGGWMGR